MKYGKRVNNGPPGYMNSAMNHFFKIELNKEHVE